MKYLHDNSLFKIGSKSDHFCFTSLILSFSSESSLFDTLVLNWLVETVLGDDDDGTEKEQNGDNQKNGNDGGQTFGG